jgi:hypothetical protein
MPAAARSIRRCIACAIQCALPHWLGAQAFAFVPAVQGEWRADAISGPPAAVQLGAGLNVTAGYYLRVGVTAAGGIAWRDGRSSGSARVDVTSRYLLDPFGELHWGLYGGAGASARLGEGRTRAYLLIVAGIEGPASHGWRTAFEAGLGGGARLGIVLRRARKSGR